MLDSPEQVLLLGLPTLVLTKTREPPSPPPLSIDIADLSRCYFNDPNGRVSRSVTNSPIKDMNRRKVVQYSRLSPADTSDVTEGHGTHVCGTVAGNNQQSVYGGLFPASCLLLLTVTTLSFSPLPFSLSRQRSLQWRRPRGPNRISGHRRLEECPLRPLRDG
jgi:hypothetical protein